MKPREDPLVSIIIPTFNSEKTLAACLWSIKRQTYPYIEVIVVDNCSEDRTREIAERMGAKVISQKSNLPQARNIGARLAKGEYLFFVDSDMELTPRVVEECVEAMKRDPKIGGIIVPELSVGDSFWAKVRNFERSFYANTELESARFYRKELVLRVGGYDEDIVFYEDHVLHQKIRRLGFDVKTRICAQILHHEDHFSLSSWLRKKHGYGRTARLYRSRYEDVSLQLGVYNRLSIFIKNKRFYSNPPLAVGVLFLKLLEYIVTMLQ